jgi:hydroxyacylglutathione hydrolase
MGWIVNYEEQIILIANENEVEDLVRKLMRIGMDNIYGFITPEELFSSDLETSSISILDRSQMEFYTKDSSVQILDVRSKKEFEAGQVPNATSIFVGHLKNKWTELDPSKKTIVYCQSGTRSAIASSFLAAKGFNIENYSGGYQDWSSQNVNKN